MKLFDAYKMLAHVHFCKRNNVVGKFEVTDGLEKKLVNLCYYSGKHGDVTCEHYQRYPKRLMDSTSYGRCNYDEKTD